MIRAVLLIFLVACAAVAALALAGDPGRATVIWLGWRADMTAAAVVLLILFSALAAMVLWRLMIWVLEAPRRAEQSRRADRRRQADEVLSRGFLAVAAGDGSEARRLAQKSANLAGETPALVRVLQAQAAEAAGDAAAAHAAYTAMLGFPEMRLAGHRGLMQLAAQEGEAQVALDHAQQAYVLVRTAPWAWRALLNAKLDAADWTGALDLVKGALDRKIVSPIVAERARAALLAASAAQLEHAPDARARDQALDQAAEAARLQPGFAPGVVMAARLLALDGKLSKASATIESAWKVAPHPALWLAYRDLRTDETPRQRAARLAELAGMSPDHRESRILFVEQALIAGEAAAARAATRALEGTPITARLAGLFARVAYAGGAPDEARMWMAQGLSAPQEPDWSDLDPEGRAFAYHASDWARLVAAFAETGELIHPRFERRERTLGELPELPAAYADSTAFIVPEGQAPLVYHGEGAFYGDPEPDDPVPPAPPPAPPPRRTTARRRLASTPRAAK